MADKKLKVLLDKVRAKKRLIEATNPHRQYDGDPAIKMLDWFIKLINEVMK